MITKELKLGIIEIDIKNNTREDLKRKIEEKISEALKNKCTSHLQIFIEGNKSTELSELLKDGEFGSNIVKESVTHENGGFYVKHLSDNSLNVEYSYELEIEY